VAILAIVLTAYLKFNACPAFSPKTSTRGSRSGGVGLDLKEFPAANYFHDLHTDGIPARSDLLTVTNFPNYDHAIPLYFYRRPDLNELGDGYAQTRFRRAIDLARNRSHDGHNYGLIGCKTRFGSTIRHPFKSAGPNRYFNDRSQRVFPKKHSVSVSCSKCVTAKDVTAELRRLGHEARLESGTGISTSPVWGQPGGSTRP
jgi:hypothetical protein